MNVVQESALGAVEVEEAEALLGAALREFPAAGGASADFDAEPRGKMRKAARAGSLAKSVPTSYASESRSAASQMKPAAEAKDVGDFCVYECNLPVSIGANRSAIIPVFETELTDGRFVLYYKREQHRERPYRAVKLTNPGPQSLGRGVCTVFQGGIYGGNCVMPATKPGEERLLPFALETGVRVIHDAPRYEVRTAKVSIAEGVCWRTTLTVRETTYSVRSTRDEKFVVVLDHPQLAKRTKLKVTQERGSDATPLAIAGTLPEGWRLEFPLAVKEHVLLRLIESRTERLKIELGDTGDIPKLEALFDQVESPLLKNAAFQRSLELQSQVAAKREEVAHANAQVQSLNNRQDRLRKNLGVGGNDEQSARWRGELGEAETRITELEQTTLPRLEQERRILEAQLREALKSVALEWILGGTDTEALA